MVSSNDFLYVNYSQDLTLTENICKKKRTKNDQKKVEKKF